MPPLNYVSSITSVALHMMSKSGQSESQAVAEEPLDFPNPLSNIGRASSAFNATVYDATKSHIVAGQHSVLISPNNANGYVMTKVLRKAIYGRVVLAEILTRLDSCSDNSSSWALTGKKCAIKQLDWNMIQNNRRHKQLFEDPLQEVAALNFFQENSKKTRPQHNRYVLTPIETLRDHEHLYVVMPYCNKGELFEALEANPNDGFSEEIARNYFRQIVSGIEALHSAGICHRDLSLENVLLHSNHYCQIIDFGMSLRMPQSSDLMSPQGACGKLFYMAPEVFHNQTFHGRAIDVWSAGAMLFMMLTGSPPCSQPDFSDGCFTWIANGKIKSLFRSWGLQISANAVNLMEGMLCIDPMRRLTLKQVKEHPWMSAGFEKIGRRRLSLKRRMSAE